MQILVERAGGRQALLFPITSQPPRSEVTALAIPPLEARRAGLRLPAWIVVDEWNEDDLSISPFVADPNPLGSFSPAFSVEIRAAAVEAIKGRAFRRVIR